MNSAGETRGDGRPAPEETSQGPCVDPEQLAAFLSDALPAPERATVVAHLATCADCREWLAESAVTLDELEAEGLDVEAPAPAAAAQPAPPVAPVLTSPRWFPARTPWVLGLSAAAVLLIAVTAGLRWRAEREAQQIVSLREGLSREMTQTRTIEPRLDGVGYGPMRVTRSASGPALPVALELASAQAEQAAASGASEAALRLQGLARIAVRDYEGAVAAFTRANAAAPASAVAASDLSAAFVARGLARGDRADLTRGVEEARRALGLDSRLATARYNEALALTRLAEGANGTQATPDQAARVQAARDAVRAAWARYFQIDPQSPWAEEGRQLLAGLEPPR